MSVPKAIPNWYRVDTSAQLFRVLSRSSMLITLGSVMGGIAIGQLEIVRRVQWTRPWLGWPEQIEIVQEPIKAMWLVLLLAGVALIIIAGFVATFGLRKTLAYDHWIRFTEDGLQLGEGEQSMSYAWGQLGNIRRVGEGIAFDVTARSDSSSEPQTIELSAYHGVTLDELCRRLETSVRRANLGMTVMDPR